MHPRGLGMQAPDRAAPRTVGPARLYPWVRSAISGPLPLWPLRGWKPSQEDKKLIDRVPQRSPITIRCVLFISCQQRLQKCARGAATNQWNAANDSKEPSWTPGAEEKCRAGLASHYLILSGR